MASGRLSLGGLDLTVAKFHKSAVALLVVGGFADVNRVRKKVLDHALVPKRAEHGRNAQIIQSVCDLAGGNRFGRVPRKNEFHVLHPFVDHRRAILERFVERLGRPVAFAVKTLPSSIGIDLDAQVMSLVNHAPYLVALGVERHDIAAVGAVASEKLALAGQRHLAGQHASSFLPLLPARRERTDGAGQDRGVVLGVKLLASGIQEAAIVVTQDREELAHFVGVLDTETVQGLHHNGLNLPSLDGTQETLKIGALVGLVSALVVLKPLVDLEAGSLDFFTLAQRVLLVRTTAKVRNGGHGWSFCKRGLASKLTAGLRRSQTKNQRFRGDNVYTPC